MLARFIWFLVRINVKLALVSVVAVLVMGALMHVQAFHVWVNNTPMVVLQDPNTGAVSTSIQPLRALGLLSQLAFDSALAQVQALIGGWL